MCRMLITMRLVCLGATRAAQWYPRLDAAASRAKRSQESEKERKTGRRLISALKGAIMWENRNYLI